MKQKFLRLIANLKFAIILLLIISLFSIIGTIIEQDQPLEVYKNNYPLANPLFHILSWDIIVFFGFNQIYKTYWFICLIVLFGLSLITCTFIQQFPSLNIARRCQFFRNYTQFNSLTVSTILSHPGYVKILSQIKRKNYSLFPVSYTHLTLPTIYSV